MNIKDYLHLYLGCEVQVKKKNDTDYKIGRICEVTRKSNHGDWIMVWFDDVVYTTSNTWEVFASNAHHFFISEDEIKLILRHLSDMTEQEKELAGNVATTVFKSAEQIKYLLSIGIDLFGLIDAGLAIDETTLKP